MQQNYNFKKLIIYPLLASLLLASCSSNKIENDLKKEGLKGEVKSVQEAHFDCSAQFSKASLENLKMYDDLKIYNKNGYLAEVKYDAESSLIKNFGKYLNYEADVTTYRYNDKSLLIEVLLADFKRLYEYNEKNEMTQVKQYNNLNGKLESTLTYTYDEHSNPVKKIEQSTMYSKKDITTFKYEYDNKHNIIKSIATKNNEHSISKEYNKNNQLIVERKFVKRLDSSYNSQEIMTEEYLYTYNDKNLLIKESIQKENKIREKVEYLYEYDRHGNWIKKIKKSNNECVMVTKREINYYNEPEKSEIKTLRASVIRLIKEVAAQKELQEKIEQFCNEESAIENVAYYMSLNYPDWKISTKIRATKIGDCKFNIQFQVINPYLSHYGYVTKEQIVAEIDLSIENYTKYNFKVIRGTLY